MNRDPEIDGQTLRMVMRRVPSPVTVVTAAGPGGALGITIGSFTSVSLKPPLISFNVAETAQMYDLLQTVDRFAVHILMDRQAALSEHFAVPDLSSAEQFETVAYHLDPDGLPILEGALAVLFCRRHAVYRAGDHALIIGEVFRVDERRDGLPIVYYNRSYRRVGDIVGESLFSPVNRSSSETP